MSTKKKKPSTPTKRTTRRKNNAKTKAFLKFLKVFSLLPITELSDLLTDREIEKYHSINKENVNMFTEIGHIMLCLILKRIYKGNFTSSSSSPSSSPSSSSSLLTLKSGGVREDSKNNSLDKVLNALSPILKISPKDWQNIKDMINFIFQDNMDRVEVVQEGGANVMEVISNTWNTSWRIFCFFVLIGQLTVYRFQFDYLNNESKIFFQDISQLPHELSLSFKLLNQQSLSEQYAELSDTPIKSTTIDIFLKNVVYPAMIDKEYRSTPEFEKNATLISTYIIIGSDRFRNLIQNPADEFASKWNPHAYRKQLKLNEVKFRRTVKKKLALLDMGVFNEFSDGSYYTTEKQKDMRKRVSSLKTLIKKITDNLSTDSNRVLLQNDEGFKKLLEKIDEISQHMEAEILELKNKLNNLSGSREISFANSDINSKKGKSIPKAETTSVVRDAFKSSLLGGIEVLKDYEKHFNKQVNAYVNTILEPVFQTMKKVKDSISNTIKVLDTNLRTIQSLGSTLYELHNENELADALNSIPRQLKLFTHVFYRAKYLLGFMSVFYFNLFYFLKRICGMGMVIALGLVDNLGEYIKSRKSRKSRSKTTIKRGLSPSEYKDRLKNLEDPVYIPKDDEDPTNTQIINSNDEDSNTQSGKS